MVRHISDQDHLVGGSGRLARFARIERDLAARQATKTLQRRGETRDGATRIRAYMGLARGRVKTIGPGARINRS